MTNTTQNRSGEQFAIAHLHVGERVGLSTCSTSYTGVVAAVDERAVRPSALAELYEVSGSGPIAGARSLTWSQITEIAIPEAPAANRASLRGRNQNRRSNTAARETRAGSG